LQGHRETLAIANRGAKVEQRHPQPAAFVIAGADDSWSWFFFPSSTSATWTIYQRWKLQLAEVLAEFASEEVERADLNTSLLQLAGGVAVFGGWLASLVDRLPTAIELPGAARGAGREGIWQGTGADEDAGSGLEGNSGRLTALRISTGASKRLQQTITQQGRRRTGPLRS